MRTTDKYLARRRSLTKGSRWQLILALICNVFILNACNTNTVINSVVGPVAVPEAPSDRKQLVLSVQRMLAQKGFNPGPVDGIDGPTTRSALRNFQDAKGLSRTAGVTATAYHQLAADGRATMGSTQYSSAVQQMKSDSMFFNQSYLEACGVGLLGGAVIGYISGDDSKEREKNMMVGAGVGCVAAMGANYWLQGQREQAAYKEADMKQMLATLKDENRKLSSLVNSSKEVVAEDRRKIQQIDDAYRKKQISLEEAKIQMAEIDDNKAHLEKTLANLEERKKNWDTLGNKVRANQSSADSKAMDTEIASLERKITTLKSELDALEQTRRVSAIG
ncbi:MAG: peptidoglycan-binding protein [Gammaproteobacteria bacterium]|nr:peptidoglycan-binding protein [Gammaproteobacteria bacterium]